MRNHRANKLMGVLVAAIAVAAAAEQPDPEDIGWRVVANNGHSIPGHASRYFNSYNPPSVNQRGLVVFRARSTGHAQGPVSGIYVRNMSKPDPAVVRIADRDTPVPQPNNTSYPGSGSQGENALASFNEFPSIPRIAIDSDIIATRGNHPPVWTYTTAASESQEQTETRAGTTGVYVNLAADQPAMSPLVTGGSLLGTVTSTPYADLSYLFRVPGVEPATRFEVFPGAPAVTDSGVIVFKGNYSVVADDGSSTSATIGRTGVFHRRIDIDYAGGLYPVQLIANSDTPLPNPGDCPAGTKFGSTAPPSAANQQAVFVGFDNEDSPQCGGIYRALLNPGTGKLKTLVGLETRVPGNKKTTFKRLGEGLSYDGRFLGFWGSWGAETTTVRLYCPEEGNRVRRDYCNHTGGFSRDPTTGEIRGDPNSVCDDNTDPRYPLCYQEKNAPTNQGVFVLDSVTGKLVSIALAGPGEPFDDFLFWNYSGAPPDVGHGQSHAEPPRFRSSAFLSISTRSGSGFRCAFLARTGSMDERTHRYVDPIDGIYLVEPKGSSRMNMATLIETGMDGTLLDDDAVWDHDENQATPLVSLPVNGLALEREGVRGRWLAISASMGVAEKGWAGVYVMHLGN